MSGWEIGGSVLDAATFAADAIVDAAVTGTLSTGAGDALGANATSDPALFVEGVRVVTTNAMIRIAATSATPTRSHRIGSTRCRLITRL